MPKYYPISKIIGNKITYYRKMKGMTLESLSNIVGVSEQQQSRYERGINRINIDRLNEYAKIFKIDIMDFFIFNPIENNDIKNGKKHSNKDK
ncbi:helix-turn-helix domain-containing protein [Providencia rettgeri]